MNLPPDLSIEQLKQLPGAQLSQFPANQYLYRPGDACENFVFLIEGCVRVEMLSTQGDQLLLYRIHGGQSCIITTASLLGSNSYSAQAFTETAVNLFLLPKNEFNQALDESKPFRHWVFDQFSGRLGILMIRIGDIFSQTIDQRLAAALLARHQSASPTKTISVTHEQLATDVGTSREVISRRLTAFEEIGCIHKGRGKVVISNPPLLEQQLQPSPD